MSRVRRVFMGGDSSSTAASGVENSAMVARGSGKGGGRGGDSGGGRGHGDKNQLHCTHCGWTNHMSDKCWDKFGKPE